MLDSKSFSAGDDTVLEAYYHLLIVIEKRFLDRGVHTSWWTLREQLSTHQVVTVVLPTKEGKVPKIRKGTTPEAIHREIYAKRCRSRRRS